MSVANNHIEYEYAEINPDGSIYPYCKQCKNKKVLAGQAFTSYICGHCFKLSTHANTHTPKICIKCARENLRCSRCCKQLLLSDNTNKTRGDDDGS